MKTAILITWLFGAFWLNWNIPKEFQDVIHWFFVFSGVIISLTIDYADEKERKRHGWRFVLFSVTVSIVFSMLMTYLQEWKNYPIFIYRITTLAVAIFSPDIVSRLKRSVPEAVDSGFTGFIGRLFKSLGDKIDKDENV